LKHEDTLLWFINDQRFQYWVKDDKARLLWIPGIPGSGKSVLSAFLTERMTELKFCIAYFFCKCTDEHLRTDTAILKYWLAQLLDQNPRIFGYFQDEPDYRKDKEKTRWTASMLWRVFQRIWTDGDLENTCLILDALGKSSSTVWI
jgi:hypothetical protein